MNTMRTANADLRVAIFVDGSNLYRSAKDIGMEVDYRLLKDRLQAKRTLVQATYFGSHREEPTDQESKILDAVEEAGFELRLRRLVKKHWTREIPPGVTFRYEVAPEANPDDLYIFEEKGVDVALATEMLSRAWQDAYDIAVLVSGDGDFAVAVQEIIRHGKEVEVATFISSPSSPLSSQLARCASRMVDLGVLLK